MERLRKTIYDYAQIFQKAFKFIYNFVSDVIKLILALVDMFR